ncbi:MAG: Transcriptional regulator, AcrR family, partial [uncultured Lysobacter sp.]
DFQQARRPRPPQRPRPPEGPHQARCDPPKRHAHVRKPGLRGREHGRNRRRCWRLEADGVQPLRRQGNAVRRCSEIPLRTGPALGSVRAGAQRAAARTPDDDRPCVLLDGDRARGDRRAPHAVHAAARVHSVEPDVLGSRSAARAGRLHRAAASPDRCGRAGDRGRSARGGAVLHPGQGRAACADGVRMLRNRHRRRRGAHCRERRVVRTRVRPARAAAECL